MIEVVGLLFGGATRLIQHYLDLGEKSAERAHEAIMYDKQIALQDRRYEHEAALRRMDAESAAQVAELQALTAAIGAQADEAKHAGGWVAKLSASVRPVVMYWLLGLYSFVKIASVSVALGEGATLIQVLPSIYGEFDAAVLSSALAFWFTDRSLRHQYSR